MITENDLARLQPLIAEAGVDGWLLFDFRGRNPIAAAVLGPEIVGSRRAYVLIPPAGTPVALVHAVDAELWRGWPTGWTKRVWVTREALSTELGALVQGKRLAVDWSPRGAIPYLDGVPLGVAEFLRDLGATLVPSADLVTRYCSVWSPADRASHRRAAEAIATIAREALALAGTRAAGDPITEHALGVWVRERFDRAGLVTESGPSVSWGPNAARAHYDPTAEESAPITRGALLLLDLWATEPGGIYADQTWMATLGEPSQRTREIWTAVRDARDAAIALVQERAAANEPLRGADVDDAARRVIESRGFEQYFTHRTGHSIDARSLHGAGPHLDNLESREERLLIPGVGFSIEPGIYIPGEIGVRSEVNAYIQPGRAVITPAEYQRELIVL